nr:ionotropic receptor [Semanotus bifasciatus]
MKDPMSPSMVPTKSTKKTPPTFCKSRAVASPPSDLLAHAPPPFFSFHHLIFNFVSTPVS